MSEEEKAALEDEVQKAEETITYSVTRKAKPSRKPLDTSKLPVQETHIYPEGTCDENGNQKPEYVEIGTEESRILETDRKHATEAIVYISKLYKVESESDEANLTPEQRSEKRIKESYPIIWAFEKWLKNTYPAVLPKSKIGQAIEYAYQLLPRLSRYVNDGRISIDNNPVENAIRPLALGRKNWLFCGNDASAYRAAIVYSLIGTCKNAGVDPRSWMEDVLRQIPYYQRDGRDLSELLPRAWATRNLIGQISN